MKTGQILVTIKEDQLVVFHHICLVLVVNLVFSHHHPFLLIYLGCFQDSLDI